MNNVRTAHYIGSILLATTVQHPALLVAYPFLGYYIFMNEPDRQEEERERARQSVQAVTWRLAVCEHQGEGALAVEQAIDGD